MGHRRLLASAFLLVLSACGGGTADESTTVPTTSVATTTTTTLPPTTTTTTLPPTTTTTKAPLPVVMGTLILGFLPWEDGAVPPPIPDTLSMVVNSGGSERTVVMSGDSSYHIDDEVVAEGFEPPEVWQEAFLSMDFRVDLPPGVYELVNLEIDDPEWGFGIPILTGFPMITVDDSACTYVGVLNFNLYRLAPGSLEQQQAVLSEVAAELGVEIFFVFLEAGGFFGESAAVGIPDEGPPDSAAGCTVQQAEFLDDN